MTVDIYEHLYERIAELEAEVARQAKEIEFLNDVGDERHAEKVNLEAERDRLKAALEQAYKDWEAAAFKGEIAAREAEREACAKIAEDFGPTSIAAQHIAAAIRARSALSGEGVTT